MIDVSVNEQFEEELYYHLEKNLKPSYSVNVVYKWILMMMWDGENYTDDGGNIGQYKIPACVTCKNIDVVVSC